MDDMDMAMDDTEYLVNRRFRRSTAGNRMAAALAEMALETTVDTVEDDQDFVNDKEEEDISGSDFESTDEEAGQTAIETGENEIKEEERRARREARSRIEKATAAAHARQKATFNPQESKAHPIAKSKRRVSLGTTVNAETGEVLYFDSSNSPKKKRHSQRRHTILNTSATATRMKESEQKKASAPRKMKAEYKAYTQAELIQLALDNEEGNIVEHRDYLRLEEEKRKRARVARPTIDGSLIRWITRGEELKILVQPSVPSALPRSHYAYAPYNVPGSLVYGQATPYYYSTQSYNSAGAYFTPVKNPSTTVPMASTLSDARTPSMGDTGSTPLKPSLSTELQQTSLQMASQPPTQPVSRTTSPPQQAPPLTVNSEPQQVFSVPELETQSSQQSTSETTSLPQLTYSSATSLQGLSQEDHASTPQRTLQPNVTEPIPQAVHEPAPQLNPYQAACYNHYMMQYQQPSINTPLWTPPLLQPIERKEKVARDYVVHELGQYDGVPKPPWNETMSAMFGDHVKWEELKVYVGKGRPMSRPKQICPITGKVAKYFDPRTGVPYADVRAYKVLTKLLNHDFAWSPGLGRYTGSFDQQDRNIHENKS